MTYFLIQLINVLPGVLMLILLTYFYSQKKIPGLLLLLIANIVLTLLAIASTFGVEYLSNRSASVTEMGRFYTIIHVVSLIMQAVSVVGMGILLQSFPARKENQKIADSF